MKDTNFARDIFQFVLAKVRERQRKLVPDLIVRRPRDAQTAWFAKRFESGCDIHAIAENVALFGNNVTDIDSDAEHDSSSIRNFRVAPCHSALDSGCPQDRATALANSISSPSPVVLTTRPWWLAIAGSTNSRRIAFRAARVPTSSAPIRRLKPTMSAATIAANLRSTGV